MSCKLEIPESIGHVTEEHINFFATEVMGWKKAYLFTCPENNYHWFYDNEVGWENNQWIFPDKYKNMKLIYERRFWGTERNTYGIMDAIDQCFGGYNPAIMAGDFGAFNPFKWIEQAMLLRDKICEGGKFRIDINSDHPARQEYYDEEGKAFWVGGGDYITIDEIFDNGWHNIKTFEPTEEKEKREDLRPLSTAFLVTCACLFCALREGPGK